jgi:MFS family permease
MYQCPFAKRKIQLSEIRSMPKPFRLLDDPICRRLWLIGVGLNVVRWLEMLAFSLYALEVSGSPFLVALTAFARLLPLSLSAWLSAWSNGFDRRHVMTGILVCLTAVDATLLILAVTGSLNLVWLLAASLVAGLCWSFENPLRRTMLVEAAGAERASESTGLEAASNQATRALGPAIGGALIAGVGLEGVVLLGVLLHAAGLAATFGLPSGLAGPRVANQTPGRALMAGLDYVRRHRLLQGTLAITFILNMWGFPYVALAPVIGERVFDLSPLGTGLLLATEATGGMIASIALVMVARPPHYVRLYSLGAFGFGLFTMTMGFWSAALPAYLALFLAGIGMACFNAMQLTVPLLASPPELRVRVMGLVTVFIASSPIGLLHAGLLAEWLGAQTAQIVIGVEGLAMFLLAYRIWPELLSTKPPEPLS